VARALESHFFEAYYVKTKEEAVEKVFSLIPQNHTVSWGGSVTLDDLGGLTALVKERGYKTIDRDAAQTPDARIDAMRQALLADTFLGSANAISETGELVNIDGMGNRVAAMIFGPKQVILVAGMNKVVPTMDEAMRRARTIAAPLNEQRFGLRQTPCALNGACGDCHSADCICNYLVTFRNSCPAKRIKVILVGENLGF
jgi:L-lactate utilization protein LutB